MVVGCGSSEGLLYVRPCPCDTQFRISILFPRHSQRVVDGGGSGWEAFKASMPQGQGAGKGAHVTD